MADEGLDLYSDAGFFHKRLCLPRSIVITMKPFAGIISSLALFTRLLLAQDVNYTSPLGVEILNPSDSIDPIGTWSLMSRAGSTLYIAGIRGIHPSNNTLAEVGYPRVLLAFENMKYLAEVGGSALVGSQGRPPDMQCQQQQQQTRRLTFR